MSYRCAVCNVYCGNLNRHLQTTGCGNADEEIIRMLSEKQVNSVPLCNSDVLKSEQSPSSSVSTRKSYYEEQMELEGAEHAEDEGSSDSSDASSDSHPPCGIAGIELTHTDTEFLAPEFLLANYGSTAVVSDYLLTSPSKIEPPDERSPQERYQAEFRTALRSLGMSSEMEYGFLKLMIEFNLSQQAGDRILSLLRAGCATAESKVDTLQMPRTTMSFYNLLDSVLKDNGSNDSGLKLMKASVKLPDLPVFRNNNLTSVNISYIDPEHFIRSLPEKYSYDDLILPKEPLRFDKDHIDDLETCHLRYLVT